MRRAQAAGRARARRERQKAERALQAKRDAKLKEKEVQAMGKTRASTRANLEILAAQNAKRGSRATTKAKL